VSTTPTPVLAVTVLGDDRPGIVADVTAAVAGLGGNLEDSTMTLLRGHFAMVVLVRTPASVPAVEAALAGIAAGGSLTVDVRELRESGMPPAPGRAWTLRVHGADRPGIVASITEVLAAHGGNIVDLGTRLGSDLYVLIAEVELPEAASGEAVAADLRAAAAAVGVTVAFEPVDDEVL
jgi:glycine cleavage system transcriptional repressor